MHCLAFRVTVVLLLLSVFSTLGWALDIQQFTGGSVVTELGLGIAVNENSTLVRTWYVVNDPACPIQLTDTGIRTSFNDRAYSYTGGGLASFDADVSAFELRFLLFDVFGDHMRTLSATEVENFGAGAKLRINDIASWRASENDVRDFLTSVVFVANARLADGTIWKSDAQALQSSLLEVKLSLTDEALLPAEE